MAVVNHPGATVRDDRAAGSNAAEPGTRRAGRDGARMGA